MQFSAQSYMKNNIQKTPPRRHVTCLLAVALITWLISTPSQAELLLHYNFNGITQENVAPDVSGNNNNGAVLGGSGAWGANQTGVSGKLGDRAFDNTKSTMGSALADTTGGAIIAPAMGNLTSFTISMWFKTDGNQSISGSARLFDANGMLLAGAHQNGVASFQMNNKEIAQNWAATNSILTTQNEWVFIAVTYNGESTTGLGNVNIYVGSANDSVVLVASNTVAITGAQSLVTTYFGSTSTYGRAFDGWLDDIRIYGDTTGDSGALLIEALDEVRLAGLNQIPEPASMALISSVVVMLVFGTLVWSRQRPN